MLSVLARTCAQRVLPPDLPRHPIIISIAYRDDVMTKFDDTGLRGLIYGHPEYVHRLPVRAPGVLRDMDTPEDYERELKEIG